MLWNRFWCEMFTKSGISVTDKKYIMHSIRDVLRPRYKYLCDTTDERNFCIVNGHKHYPGKFVLFL